MIKELITHEGFFHVDDVMAGAILTTLYPHAKVIRSRDEKYITPNNERIIWDVGHTYDPKMRVFDHHQTEGAGERENKIPYASLGLIWKHYGREYLSKMGVPRDKMEEIWELTDENFIQPLDAHDTGVTPIKNVGDFTKAVSSRVPTSRVIKNPEGQWANEMVITQKDYLTGYLEMVELAKHQLKSYVRRVMINTEIPDEQIYLAVKWIIVASIRKCAGDNNWFAEISPNFLSKVISGQETDKVDIWDFWEQYKEEIFNKLNVPGPYRSKISYKIKSQLLSSAKIKEFRNPTALYNSVENALISSYPNIMDMAESISGVVSYLSLLIYNFINNINNASVSREMVKETIETPANVKGCESADIAPQLLREQGILLLPTSGEYTSVVRTYNAIHKDHPIFSVVYPIQTEAGELWNLKHITISPKSYDCFKKIPVNARGKRDDDIAIGLGYNPKYYAGKFKFSHNNGHLLVAKDCEAAIKAAIDSQFTPEGLAYFEELKQGNLNEIDVEGDDDV